MIASASTNGGRLGRVHAEFDDGYIFTIRRGKDYVPVVFDFYDIFDCRHRSVIATGPVYHDKLLRRDGGWREHKHFLTPTFSWSRMGAVKVKEGLCGEDMTNKKRYAFELDRAEDAALCDLVIDRSTRYRCDSTYWRIDKTVQNESSYELFGFSQSDPRTCCEENCDKPCSPDSWFARAGCDKGPGDCLILNDNMEGEQ